MKTNKLEIEVGELISIINDKMAQYYSIYQCEPKAIVVPDYVEYVMRSYLHIRTSVALNDEVYSTFMGMLVIGTKKITDIKEIEAF